MIAVQDAVSDPLRRCGGLCYNSFRQKQLLRDT